VERSRRRCDAFDASRLLLQFVVAHCHTCTISRAPLDSRAQNWIDTPSVKMLVGQDADDEVRNRLPVAFVFLFSVISDQIAIRAEAAKKAMVVDNERAQVIRLKDVLLITEGPSTGLIASGGGLLNGWYEPTKELSASGRVIYIKRGNDNLFIEHFQGK
jgi:hypothetical protein